MTTFGGVIDKTSHVFIDDLGFVTSLLPLKVWRQPQVKARSHINDNVVIIGVAIRTTTEVITANRLGIYLVTAFGHHK